jgi:PAS domain-containing protein
MNEMSSRTTHQNGALRLIYSATAAQEEAWEGVWFCGRCATPAPPGRPPHPEARVCQACGLGILLETRADAVPQAQDPFVIVDAALQVQALSSEAERMLAVPEEQAIHRPVGELLVPAAVDAGGEDEFARAVVSAASASGGLTHTYVRPWNTFGVRLRARIGTCGPPRAALLVLSSGKSPLRAVS